jgi:hypothetical protein
MILPLASAYDHLRGRLDRDARRLRHVARDPGRCTAADIELLLRAHGVPETKVWEATDSLAAGDVSAPVAWAFAMAHDGIALADALVDTTHAADLRHDVGGAPGLTG